MVVESRQYIGLAIGLPIIAFCIILSFCAFKRDQVDRGNEEADAALKDFEKRKSKHSDKYKYKQKLYYAFIVYEFFQLASFGFTFSIPWKINFIPKVVNTASLIPEGVAFLVLFWIAFFGMFVFIVSDLLVNMVCLFYSLFIHFLFSFYFHFLFSVFIHFLFSLFISLFIFTFYFHFLFFTFYFSLFIFFIFLSTFYFLFTFYYQKIK